MKFWEKIKNNPHLRKNLITRASVLKELRVFFSRENFLEVDTPLLVQTPGLEPYLNPLEVKFLTNRQTLVPAHLITSPEFALKKLLAAGFERVFQLNKCWRGGEPYGGTHNPEFTMIEWYRANSDYQQLMSDCEQLVHSVHQAVCDANNVPYDGWLTYRGRKINLSAPWKKLSVKDAWNQYTKLNLDEMLTTERMAETVRAMGLTVAPDDEFDDLFFKIFLTYIEPQLQKDIPLILYDYPIQLAALARAKQEDPRYAERFELYIGGIEIGNGYSELVDANIQQQRFEIDQAKRRQLGKNVYTIDTDFIDALKSGIPPSAGYSIGVDRLVMLFTDAASIDDVIYFPASDLFI
ncbi:MAG: tRNA synthetase class II (D K and N) [Candidatus Magasanikbacteria bacterium GW2011_GWA2_45_39]|uniref:tRNA synthetase class II (D K and N) n=2 Tax=Candidatus Magasanikiibacteriota TaxID=1752731 RepID=A0A0G1MGW6_9BACT|nr:MAG: tRNA synthetase class II (D K and N) [Candidatus Magasanikbacteria bacterium GW2011_GWA2_45_39]